MSWPVLAIDRTSMIKLHMKFDAKSEIETHIACNGDLMNSKSYFAKAGDR